MQPSSFLRLLPYLIQWGWVFLQYRYMEHLLTDVAGLTASVSLFFCNMCTGNYLVYANFDNLALGVLSISVWRSMICALHWMIIPNEPTNELYVPLMLPIEAKG